VEALADGGWLGAEGESAADWEALWTFALTFDGYRYFGGDPSVHNRLGAFAHSVRGVLRRAWEAAEHRSGFAQGVSVL
jgi:hypothetical protein